MQITKKELPKSQMELTVEISVEEMGPFLKKAAEEISESKKIAGFRPGKAPLNIVIKEVGEMNVYQTAANHAINKTLSETLVKENIEPVDQPAVEVLKLAPGNPFSYKATVDLLPAITICDYSKVSVTPTTDIVVKDADVEKTLEDLRKMRAQEVLEDKTAENGDKIEIDFDLFVDNIPIEDGSVKKHNVHLGAHRMIPGFEEQLIGLKKDDTKEFELTMPKEYHAKNLAGKKATFKIKVNSVFKVTLPKLNDEFAKMLGLKTLEDLKNNIRTNIKLEKEQKEKQRVELEMIEALIDKSDFGDLPDTLVNQETHKMMHELQDNIARQGMKLEDYLNHIKKTEAEMLLDFVPDALKRVKTALLVREVAKKENVQVEEKEINDEMERALASYKLNPAFAGQIDELEKSMKSENAKRYFGNLLKNRKTIEFLKGKIIKE